MQTAFDPRCGEWNVTWPGRLAQHDIVYLSPPEDPSQGLPIGNGDLGAMLWTEPNQLILAINKCDTWDDANLGAFDSWSAALEEHHPVLRHCARLVIDFQQPVFDLLYQQQFEGRLELARAAARVQACTPFSVVGVQALGSAAYKVLLVDVQRDAPQGESAPCLVRLERWGSRTFAHWYHQIRRDPTLGLGGTTTQVERGRIVIEQELTSLRFVVAAQVLPADDPAPQPRVLHRRAAEYTLVENGRFRVLVTCVTSENAADPRTEAHRLLDEAVAAQDGLVAQHEDEWRRFWQASYLSLPSKPYLENIWHLVLYWANSSSRGAYPPHFCTGLWRWNRDFLPWNYFFHWNEQWYVWPLHPANHAELADPYLTFRRNGLERACQDTRERRNRPGAFYSDVTDRNGYNDTIEEDNHTPSAQIALDFWRHYRYTGDEAFLRESAWPVMREATRFMVSWLVLGDDGLYHTTGGGVYEGTPPFNDAVTDLAMLRALLPAALDAAGRVGYADPEVAQWAEMLAKLTPFRLEPLTEREVERRDGETILRAGLGKGRAVPSEVVPAVGQRPADGAWVRMRYAGFLTDYYGIPDGEMSPVFPAGIVGLNDPDSPLFKAEVTHLMCHPSTHPDPKREQGADMAGTDDVCMGWCPYAVGLARLGMAEDLARELENSISTWQFYPQGLGHYGPYHVFRPDMRERWRTNQVLDADRPAGTEEFKPFAVWPFRHFTNEAMPIAATAMNEMLLQSHEGLIRVCPATPTDWPARFTLLAQGGFLVSAQKTAAEPDWVCIESQRGGSCRLANPWPALGAVCCCELDGSGQEENTKTLCVRAGVLEWTTCPGHRYLLGPQPLALATWQVLAETPTPNQAPRQLGQAQLGLYKTY